MGEQLNKLLKSFKSNNWGGGQLEVSMVREWGRNVQLHEIVSQYICMLSYYAVTMMTDTRCELFTTTHRVGNWHNPDKNTYGYLRDHRSCSSWTRGSYY